VRAEKYRKEKKNAKRTDRKVLLSKVFSKGAGAG